MSSAAAPANPTEVDVLIAGAGLVGLALAAALAESGLSIALADRAPVATPEFPDGSEDWDSRIYAVSPGSAGFLHGLGAWQRLPCERIQAIESMRVEGDRGGSIGFSAYDLGERALAWIVEERRLRLALMPLVCAAGVAVLPPREFSTIGWSEAHAELRFTDGAAIRARLIVGADGLKSWVREAAGMHATPKPYRQTAVVANFGCARAHHGRASQWFHDDGGVLAWLPLPGRRVSMVWSAPEALAQELLALEPEALTAKVAVAGRCTLGAMTCITRAAAFPLYSLKLPAVIGHRLALIGDAAHGVHPLAGQGVNLGFGDADALAAVLRARGGIADVGNPFLLSRYADRRAEPVQAMHMMTDGLVRLFGSTAPWVRTARNLGLAAVDRLPLAKRLLARPALRSLPPRFTGESR